MIVNWVLKTAMLSPGKTDLMAMPRRGMQQSQMKNAMAEKKSKSTIVTIALRTGVG